MWLIIINNYNTKSCDIVLTRNQLNKDPISLYDFYLHFKLHSVFCAKGSPLMSSLQWRYDECNGFSDHRRLHCLLNCCFRRRSKKSSKLRITSLCMGNSPVTDEFLSQRISSAQNVFIWWRHHVSCRCKSQGGHGDPGNCTGWMTEVITVTSNVRHGVSNYRPIVCLFIRLLRLTIKEHQMSALQAHCKGNPPVTGRFISQKASYTKNVSNRWRHNCISSPKWRYHLYSKLNKSETLYKWCSGKSDTAPNPR